MTLLTFAHRGEAQYFLVELGARPHQIPGLPFDGLYQFEGGYLLITGEGIDQSLIRVSITLSLLPDVTEVLNLGVCAALTDKIELGAICQIRTCYRSGFRKNNVEFKSYTATPKIKLPFEVYDCMSTDFRVINHQQMSFLENFAPLVDRELWAVQMAASQFNIPCSSLKLISDHAGDDQREICQVVKDDAPKFSEALFQAWNIYREGQTSSDEKSIIDEDQLDQILGDYRESFHFTHSMRNKALSLLGTLSIQGDKLNIDFEAIKERHPHRKQRGILLLEELKRMMNPHQSLIEERLNSALEPIRKNGLKATFPRDLETSEVQIQFSAKSKKELIKYKEILDEEQFDKAIRILNGEYDV